MVKIGIFEDSLDDLVRRYSCISGENDLIVMVSMGTLYDAFGGKMLMSPDFGVKLVTNLSNRGLNVKEAGSISMEVPECDLYFTDGLRGGCFEIADKCRKERTYILTGSPEIEKRARESGYNLVREETKEALEEIIGKYR